MAKPRKKNSPGIYGKTKKYLDKAISRAKQAEKEIEKVETDNPSTKVYKLVEDLEILKQANQQRPYSSLK